MDIRISSYGSLATQSFPRLGNLPATTTASNAALAAPVAPVGAIGASPIKAVIPDNATLGSLLAANPGMNPSKGPGQIIDIYA